jgi:polysaccharide export outer membrane protein
MLIACSLCVPAFGLLGAGSALPVFTEFTPNPFSAGSNSVPLTPKRDSKGPEFSDLSPTSRAAGIVPTNAAPVPDDQQKLGPGDRITYRVIEDEEDPHSLTVTDSGDVEVPYLGLVHAAGKTSAQLAKDVKALLEQKLYYQATVIIAVELVNKTRVTGKVYVTGQVRNKGGYEIPAGETLTVSKAILHAGGFSDFSDKKHVRLIRKTAQGERTYIVNVQAVWEKSMLQADLVVQPDDMIVVPARLVNY